MRVNKSFCVHSLWVASIIFFILRIMYVIGIQLSEAMFLLFFKILLMVRVEENCWLNVEV